MSVMPTVYFNAWRGDFSVSTLRLGESLADFQRDIIIIGLPSPGLVVGGD